MGCFLCISQVLLEQEGDFGALRGDGSSNQGLGNPQDIRGGRGVGRFVSGPLRVKAWEITQGHTGLRQPPGTPGSSTKLSVGFIPCYAEGQLRASVGLRRIAGLLARQDLLSLLTVPIYWLLPGIPSVTTKLPLGSKQEDDGARSGQVL